MRCHSARARVQSVRCDARHRTPERRARGARTRDRRTHRCRTSRRLYRRVARRGRAPRARDALADALAQCMRWTTRLARGALHLMKHDLTIRCSRWPTVARNAIEDEPQPRAAVIVSGATAVPRGYYAAFAAYLAGCGAVARHLDYRGSGEPAEQLRRSDARMRDWGERDASGVIASMRARYRPLCAAPGRTFLWRSCAASCAEQLRSVRARSPSHRFWAIRGNCRSPTTAGSMR